MVLAHPPSNRLLLRPTKLAEKERLRGKPVDHPLIHGTLSLVKRERTYLLPLLLTLPIRVSPQHGSTLSSLLFIISHLFSPPKKEKVNRSIFEKNYLSITRTDISSLEPFDTNPDREFVRNLFRNGF